MKTIIAAVCLGWLAVGCAQLQIGQPVAEQNLQVLRSGFTTKDEVRKYFGMPLHLVQGPEGEIWVYRYSDGKSNNKPTELTISFNGSLVSTFSHH